VPALQNYTYFADLFARYQTHTYDHSYVLRPQLKDVTKRYWVFCHHSGTPGNGHGITVDNQRQKTVTSKTGCPFFLVVRWNMEDQAWHVIERVMHHNHPAQDALAYHTLRKIDQRHYELIDLLDAGKAPSKTILATIKKLDPFCRATKYDLYNLQQMVHIIYLV
jgi:hypothetical protein